jgi:hypothetical protein
MSKGSKCPDAEARAMTMKALQIETVMTAANRPMVGGDSCRRR